jgi:hypothetical protein
VYALLELLRAPNATTRSKRNESSKYNLEILIVDYSTPMEDVYISLVKVVVFATRKINTICACKHGRMLGLLS